MQQFLEDPTTIHYDGSLDSIVSRMAADNLLDGQVYSPLADDEEDPTPVSEEQAEQMALEI